jgi:hypothetical protein
MQRGFHGSSVAFAPDTSLDALAHGASNDSDAKERERERAAEWRQHDENEYVRRVDGQSNVSAVHV